MQRHVVAPTHQTRERLQGSAERLTKHEFSSSRRYPAVPQSFCWVWFSRNDQSVLTEIAGIGIERSLRGNGNLLRN